jgi:hypothetical protein
MKIQTVDVNVREWWDRINGNHYFSGLITINYGMPDAIALKIPFGYGYGNHSEYVALEILTKAGYFPEHRDTCPSIYYRDNGIIYRYSKQENCRKRDCLALVA